MQHETPTPLSPYDVVRNDLLQTVEQDRAELASAKDLEGTISHITISRLEPLSWHVRYWLYNDPEKLPLTFDEAERLNKEYLQLTGLDQITRPFPWQENPRQYYNDSMKEGIRNGVEPFELAQKLQPLVVRMQQSQGDTPT